MTSIENSDLPLVHALWIGEKLGPVAAACLRSFKRAGHAVVLHSYSDVADLPAGIQASDAALIVPRNRIIRHRKTGSFALFSDIFRYELLRRNEGSIYVDCDVYCVRPIPFADVIMGYERDGVINGAVLALPGNSGILADLLQAVNGRRFIPPWLSHSKATKLRLNRLLGRQGIEYLPWGSLGPRALTYLAERHSLLDKAQPTDVFYPVDMDRITLLFDPELSIGDLITPRTKCIHIYNEVVRRQRLVNIPPTSPLGRMIGACTG